MTALALVLSTAVLVLALVSAGLLTRLHDLGAAVEELRGRFEMETIAGRARPISHLNSTDARYDWTDLHGVVVFLSDSCAACREIVHAAIHDADMVPAELQTRISFLVRQGDSRHIADLRSAGLPVFVVADWPLMPWPSRVPHAAVHGPEGDYRYGHAVPRVDSLRAFLWRVSARIEEDRGSPTPTNSEAAVDSTDSPHRS